MYKVFMKIIFISPNIAESLAEALSLNLYIVYPRTYKNSLCCRSNYFVYLCQLLLHTLQFVGKMVHVAST